MGIDTYTTAQAQKLLARIGPPEWSDGCGPERTQRLSYRRGNWQPMAIHRPGFGYYLSDHVALCILRNHLREWLAAQGRGLRYHAEIDDEDPNFLETDYDEVLLAGCRAMLDEIKPGKGD